MHSWHAYPFFRFFFPFAFGILLAIYTELPPVHHKPVLMIIVLASFFLAALGYVISSYKIRWLSGFLIYLFLAVAGYALTVFQTPKFDQSNIFNQDYVHKTFIVRISEPLIPKENSYKTLGKLEWLCDSSGCKSVSGKVLLYFQKDSSAPKPVYGDYLWIGSQISEISPPGNPHQFDYRRFLLHSGIYHQAYVRPGDWVETKDQWVNPVFRFAYEARDFMLQILEKNGLKGDEFAVVSAILLGYDEHMDQDLRKKYAGAGALHVLCVSGLHVGIVFLLLSFVLKPLNRKKYLRFLKVFLLLLSIWTYAFITGLSPSVMRASVMFSLFAWRESRKEKSNPYNILAASAFILLAIDPYMITKIGFQLSYAAVLAIVSLYNPIYNLLQVKNIILDYFWKLSVVSLAAQIGTFPLAIYYFHQFPVYFFISNIIIIPLVWLILNTGIGVLAVSVFSGFLSAKLSVLLYLMLILLNGAVEFVNLLPGATIGGLVLNLPQVVLIYLFIVAMARAIFLRSTPLLILAFVGVLMLSGSFVFRRHQILQQEKIIVYRVNQHSALDIISGQQTVFLADSALFHNQQAMDFNISGNRTFAGIKRVDTLSLFPLKPSASSNLVKSLRIIEPGFLVFGNTRIAMVSGSFGNYKPVTPLEVDVLILSNNPKQDISDFKSQFSFGNLVFDASNNWWNIQKWRAYCDSAGISYHDIKNDGYFKMDL